MKSNKYKNPSIFLELSPCFSFVLLYGFDDKVVWTIVVVSLLTSCMECVCFLNLSKPESSLNVQFSVERVLFNQIFQRNMN